MPFPRLSDVAVAPQTLVAIDRDADSADSHMDRAAGPLLKRAATRARDRARAFFRIATTPAQPSRGRWAPVSVSRNRRTTASARGALSHPRRRPPG